MVGPRDKARSKLLPGLLGSRGLFGPREARKTITATPSKAPKDCVIWAIGDIHGRVDLLRPLVKAVMTEMELSQADRRVLVFLGDYIDRGPHSKQVMDVLAEVSAQASCEVHLLRGNHEDRFMAFMADPSTGPAWCGYGGSETLHSYGLRPPSAHEGPAAWAATSSALVETLPADHRRLLGGMKTCLMVGDYFFAHAGARPDVLLSDQDPSDLMWIRDDFLQSPVGFDHVIVHGHSPCDVVHSDGRRIGIDTGAYATGRLTALRLEGGDRMILQTMTTGGQIELQRSSLLR